jgi:ferrous iron transport protein B
VFAFLVFILAYTPCVATLAAQAREIGLRWTALGLAVQLSVAWLLAVAVFQVGRLFT